MIGWDALVEAKIAEAQRAGAFDDLPGAGQPLALDDERPWKWGQRRVSGHSGSGVRDEFPATAARVNEAGEETRL